MFKPPHLNRFISLADTVVWKQRKYINKIMSNTDFNNSFHQFGPDDCRYRACFLMMLRKRFIRTTTNSWKSSHVGGKNCNSSPLKTLILLGGLLTSTAAYAYVIKTDQEKMRHKNPTGSSEGGAVGVGGGRLGGVWAQYSITSFLLPLSGYSLHHAHDMVINGFVYCTIVTSRYRPSWHAALPCTALKWSLVFI